MTNKQDDSTETITPSAKAPKKAHYHCSHHTLPHSSIIQKIVLWNKYQYHMLLRTRLQHNNSSCIIGQTWGTFKISGNQLKEVPGWFTAIQPPIFLYRFTKKKISRWLIGPGNLSHRMLFKKMLDLVQNTLWEQGQVTILQLQLKSTLKASIWPDIHQWHQARAHWAMTREP